MLVLVAAAGELAERATGAGVVCVLHGGRPIPLACPDRTLDVVTLFGTATLVDADDLAVALAVIAETYPGRCGEVMLRPDASALVRVRPAQTRVDGVPVDPDAYRTARPDPLAADSDRVVSHLVHDHPERVMALAHLLDPVLVAEARMLAPVRVDRYGLVVNDEPPRSCSASGGGGRWRAGPVGRRTDPGCRPTRWRRTSGVLVAPGGAGHSADGPVGDPAAVGVEQPAQERAGVLVDDLLLPWFLHDRPSVLLAGAVLGEQAGPVLRAALHLDASLLVDVVHRRAEGRSHRRIHLGHHPGPGVGAVDRQERGTAAPHRDVSVTEVHTERVRVGGGQGGVGAARAGPHRSGPARRAPRRQ